MGVSIQQWEWKAHYQSSVGMFSEVGDLNTRNRSGHRYCKCDVWIIQVLFCALRCISDGKHVPGDEAP